eukprot:746419-Pelagomonas_calceolata.AAC.1
MAIGGRGYWLGPPSEGPNHPRPPAPKWPSKITYLTFARAIKTFLTHRAPPKIALDRLDEQSAVGVLLGLAAVAVPGKVAS